MPRKSSPQFKILLGLKKVHDCRILPGATDDGLRLGLSVTGVLAEGTTARTGKVLIELSDAGAQKVVLHLLANMRPRPRNTLVRVMRGLGLGPAVARMRPSRRD